jgi:hypothetical protein
VIRSLASEAPGRLLESDTTGRSTIAPTIIGSSRCRTSLKERTMLAYRLLHAQTQPEFQEVPEPHAGPGQAVTPAGQEVEMTTTTIQTQKETASKQSADAQQKIQELRALYADAPELSRRALEHVFQELTEQVAQTPPPPVESAGRAGSRLGKVSELTLIVPLAPGGARRLRTFLRLLGGNLNGADKVGTVHDMRFVFLDNDTKLLFATAYDGDWDAYIDDFATRIPDYLDVLNAGWEGWPGIRSPEAKNYLARHQVTAEGWYVANDLTVAETRRLKRVGKAVDELLDKIGGA